MSRRQPAPPAPVPAPKPPAQAAAPTTIDYEALARKYGGRPVGASAADATFPDMSPTAVDLARPPSKGASGGWSPNDPYSEFDPNKPFLERLGGHLANYGSSGVKMLGDIGSFIAEIPNIAGTVMMEPTVGEKALKVGEIASSVPGAIKEHYSGRYGSMEAIGRTMHEDPVGVLGDVSAISALGGIRANTAAKLAKAGAMKNTPFNWQRISQRLQSLSQSTDPVQGMFQGAAAIGGGASRLAGRVGELSLGAATGTGGAMSVALRPRTPIQFMNWARTRGGILPTMRGQVNEFHVIDSARQQLNQVRQNRAYRYNQQRTRVMAGAPQQLSLRQTNRTMQQEIANFSTRGGHQRDLMLIVNDADRTRAIEIANQVMRWNREHRTGPVDLDDLKQILDGYTGEMVTDRGRAFSQRIADTVRDELQRNVPGYRAMTAEYAETTEAINALTKELSLGENVNPATAARKLMQTFTSPSRAREVLVEALDTMTNGQLREQIAGLALSSWTPRGIMRPLSASNIGKTLGTAAAGGTLMIGAGPEIAIPIAALTAATTSPRIMGELLVAIGLVRDGIVQPVVRVVGKGAKSTLAVPAIALQEQIERDRNDPAFGRFQPTPPPPLIP